MCCVCAAIFSGNENFSSRKRSENFEGKLSQTMDNLLLKQKRVKFSSLDREKQEELERITERRQEQRKHYSSREMSRDNERNSDFAMAVAAASFAVRSLEQAEIMKREALEASKTKARSRKGEITLSSGGPTRLLSNKEAKRAGDRVAEKVQPVKQPNRTISVKQAAPAEARPSTRLASRGPVGESRLDSWEEDQLKKLGIRYEKTKSAILDWEKERKMQAKLKMEKRKLLVEQRRAHNMQHYQNKVARIDQIAGGARSQLEEKRRNEELAVKERAKKIRSRGNVPFRNRFCFTC